MISPLKVCFIKEYFFCYSNLMSNYYKTNENSGFQKEKWGILFWVAFYEYISMLIKCFLKVYYKKEEENDAIPGLKVCFSRGYHSCYRKEMPKVYSTHRNKRGFDMKMWGTLFHFRWRKFLSQWIASGGVKLTQLFSI